MMYNIYTFVWKIKENCKLDLSHTNRQTEGLGEHVDMSTLVSNMQCEIVICGYVCMGIQSAV